MKKGDKKNAYEVFGFSFLRFKIGANQFSIKFCKNVLSAILKCPL